jgi:tetratricopeptide (TPR) repeat protein
MLRAGYAALATHDFDGAREYSRQALAHPESRAAALVLAGRIERCGLDASAASDFFERAVLADPAQFDGYLELVRLHCADPGMAARVAALALERAAPGPTELAAMAEVLAPIAPRQAYRFYERALAQGAAASDLDRRWVESLLRLGDMPAAQTAARSPVARACVAEAAGQLLVAEQLLREASAQGDDAQASLRLCAVLARQGRAEEAESLLDSLLARSPEDAELQCVKASYLLRRGQFLRGFEALEGRRRAPGFGGVLDAPVRLWRGEDLQNKRILVLDEDDLGDSMMLVRFLPRLAKLGAHVRYVCRSELYSLYASQPSFRHIEIRAEGAAHAPADSCDFFTTLPSLPHRLGIDNPRSPAYLAPTGALSEAWRQRLVLLKRPRIGLLWSANLGTAGGRERSVPMAALGPVFAVDDVTFVALQGLSDGSVAPSPAQLPRPMEDFADIAAVLHNLDALVTVDTAIAQLAGALGLPLFVMTPRNTDWRWAGDGRPYWHGSARVFAQREPGEWAPVVQAVAAALKHGVGD